MKITKGKLNQFLFFKLPSAWWCGVRVKSITQNFCKVTVTHKWINQNPFKSMYFAVQAMAAELSTGALVMRAINSNKSTKISMLVAQNQAIFSKKATGKITFTCSENEKIDKAIVNTIATGKGQTFWLSSNGVNEAGEEVCNFKFEWTVRLKNLK